MLGHGTKYVLQFTLDIYSSTRRDNGRIVKHCDRCRNADNVQGSMVYSNLGLSVMRLANAGMDMSCIIKAKY
jgi:hypothetical protein